MPLTPSAITLAMESPWRAWSPTSSRRRSMSSTMRISSLNVWHFLKKRHFIAWTIAGCGAWSNAMRRTPPSVSESKCMTFLILLPSSRAGSHLSMTASKSWSASQRVVMVAGWRRTCQKLCTSRPNEKPSTFTWPVMDSRWMCSSAALQPFPARSLEKKFWKRTGASGIVGPQFVLLHTAKCSNSVRCSAKLWSWPNCGPGTWLSLAGMRSEGHAAFWLSWLSDTFVFQLRVCLHGTFFWNSWGSVQPKKFSQSCGIGLSLGKTHASTGGRVPESLILWIQRTMSQGPFASGVFSANMPASLCRRWDMQFA